MHRIWENPPGYENPPEDEDDVEEDGDYVELDDPADWPADICDPMWSPQPRD